jgi:serine/threonine protein kinase
MNSHASCSSNVSELEIDVDEITDLDLSTPLGGGRFGSIFRAKWRKMWIAVKLCTNRDSFDRQLRHMAALNHENIVKIYGYFNQDLESRLVFEYAENGSLYDLLHPSMSRRGVRLFSACS